jgi:predicted enzyme related to lactoylglutathione lyase
MLIKIQNVYQVTRDMDRALDFYRDLLGMKTRFQDGARWCQLDANGANFALAAPEEAAEGAAGATVVFEVESMDQARAALADQGIEITGERDMGSHGRTLTCRDPDGNVVQLFERAKG